MHYGNVYPGEENNDVVDVTENPSETGKQFGNNQESNTAPINEKSLKEKFLAKISLGLKFARSANKIDRVNLKKELEDYGRRRRLMWHLRTNEQTFSSDKFRRKSNFKPRNKDVVIKTYLSCLAERLLATEIPSKRYNNFTKEECEFSHSLRNDSAIIIKGSDKGSVVVSGIGQNI